MNVFIFVIFCIEISVSKQSPHSATSELGLSCLSITPPHTHTHKKGQKRVNGLQNILKKEFAQIAPFCEQLTRPRAYWSTGFFFLLQIWQ